jgi:FkbM family methyltransferase
MAQTNSEHFRKVMFERSLGWRRVLKPGDVAVQAGIHTEGPDSDIFSLADAVGPNGKVVGFEADPVNFEQAKVDLKRRGFMSRVELVRAATYKEPGQAKFRIAPKRTANRLAIVADSCFSGEEVETELVRIDDELERLGIPFGTVRHVNLTINGAEFAALQGMARLFEASEHLSLTVVAGREQEPRGIGYLNGRPDHEVISEFLESRGFRTRLRRFRPGGFGYVVAAKGNQPFFM